MKHIGEGSRKDSRRVRRYSSDTPWKIAGTILLILQAAASFYLFKQAFTLGMLPDSFVSALAVLLLAMLVVIFALLFSGKRNNMARILRRITAVILAIAVSAGSVIAGNVMSSVQNAVKGITSNTPVNIRSAEIAATMNVYVLSDDPARNLSDCKDYTFAVMGNNEGPSSFAAVTRINEVTGNNVADKEFASSTKMVRALYDGEVNALILNVRYTGIMKEMDEFSGFADKTRVISTLEISKDELADAEVSNPYAKGINDSPLELEPATQKVDHVELDPFIVYISGSDTREEFFVAERSDVNILMVVNPQTKQILLVNTPRDYYIPNPLSSIGTEDKLTHLGIYGVDCSITGLENLYDCEVNYYVQINFTGTERLIDDVGGLTIDNPQAFEGRGVYFPEGEITLNGEEAVIYARERYAFVEGDNMRGQNHMRLIRALIDKFTSPDTSTLLNYQKILADLDGFLVTNLEDEEINTLVKMQLTDMASWDIKTYAVTGWGSFETTYSAPYDELYVCHPYESSVIKGMDLIDRVLDGEILTDEDCEIEYY